MLGPLGWQETIFIFLLALLIFGPKKLPELGKQVGKAMTEFRRASSELKSTFDREMNNLERETEIREVTNSINAATSDSSNYDYYDSPEYDSYTGESSAQPSTASASASQGAQSTNTEAPEGTIAKGSLANESKPESAGGEPPEAKPVAS